jgi:hypothetical protein
MHLGAYFDPGMISSLPEDLTTLNKAQLENIFAVPFQSAEPQGIRIIKSHVFSNHIHYLKELFPETPVVMVHRGDDACLGWWVKCGHFDITYPDYHEYFQDFKTMAGIIHRQNQSIQNAIWDYKSTRKHPSNNLELCDALGIQYPGSEYRQNYNKSDIKVTVI